MNYPKSEGIGKKRLRNCLSFWKGKAGKKGPCPLLSGFGEEKLVSISRRRGKNKWELGQR